MPNPLSSEFKDVMIHTNDLDFIPDLRSRECFIVMCYFSQARITYTFSENHERNSAKHILKREDDGKVYKLLSILKVCAEDGTVIWDKASGQLNHE